METQNNFIPCTLPLGPKEFKLLMTDKNTVFLVDLPKSEKLKNPKAQIAFMANANIPARIDFKAENLTNEMIEAFLVEWMGTNNIIDIPPIKNIVAKIILFACNMDYESVSAPEQITIDFMNNFINRNEDLIGRWVVFLDSVFNVFVPEFMKQDDISMEDYVYKGNCPVLEDRSFIGKNIALLFGVEGFSVAYLANPIPPTNNIFFKHQFIDYMFKNQHLSAYVDVPENGALVFLKASYSLLDKLKEKENG